MEVKMRPARSLFLLVGFAVGLSSVASGGSAVVGDLFFDTFRVFNPINLQTTHDATVQRVHFSFDGTSNYTLAAPVLVKDLGASGDADGLIFIPGGDLLIGGSLTHSLIRLTTTGTIVGSVNVGGT